MNSKKRKKGLAVVLVLLLCFAFAVPLAAASGDDFGLDIEVVLAEDGSATIKEIWDINANQGTEIYKQLFNMDGMEVHDFQVEEDGKKYEQLEWWDVDASQEEKAFKSGVVGTDEGYELCFGVGEYGRHKYELSYKITGFVYQLEDAFAVNFQFVSPEMNVKPNEMTIKISGVNVNPDTRVYGFGFEGDIHVEGEEGDYYILAVSDGEVDYANVFAGFEEGSFTDANQTYASRSLEDMIDEAREGSDYTDSSGGGFPWFHVIVSVIFLGGILTAVTASSKKNKRLKTLEFTDGRNELPAYKDVNYFRDIPANKDMFLFYYIARQADLVDEQTAQSGLVSAILLNWIRTKKVEFDKTEKKGIFSSKDTFTIHFLDDGNGLSTPMEKVLYGYFREAAGANLVLEDKEFEHWCTKNYESMTGWFASVDTAVAGMLGKNGYGETQTVKQKVMFFDTNIIKTIYTPKFREELLHCIGFKRFLEEFGSLGEKQVKEVVLWEEYLLFASILGMADKVEKEIGRLYPEFNEQSDIDIFYTSMATRAFVLHSISNVHSAESAARFEGSGGSTSFSGGGSSFGGGGGGGGFR
ncbi:DUF2207 domain-containing protein [Ohessyouella blattaphilus]|uniref:DUF2207 domain-containing protein n=1 Tax=Ohessyouella blattaphilus TaxID=2949333 RepID=A0ABT1EE55_9FIRM|nr:DUF2207 domain-containing protein [Ohessyouella blattaphilus]MCP1108989.1 DUF2207 domain-containing protein [Ohessyouella blattaphilus]MCR8562383.1 DUF2207 domain-containing protein [Ohessyouella blattaphilus]